MTLGKVKKEISIFFVFALFITMLAGCSDISTISINEDGSGRYEETYSISKQLWDLAFADAGGDDMVLGKLKTIYPGSEATIEDTQVNGIESKKINFKMDFSNTKEFQQILNSMGIYSVQYNSKYFCRSVIASPDVVSDEADDMGSISDSLGALLGEDEEFLDLLTNELENMDVQMTIVFPYAVTDTNGTLQEDGRTVIWNAKQLADQESVSRIYALFGEQDSKKAPKYSGAKNGKYYNTVVTLNVDSENLLDYVSVNGEKYETDYLSISSEGSYKIVAVDKNNGKSTIKFQIDTTKPTIKGVKNGKTYKKAVVLKFSDTGSGMKNATLNGKKVVSGKKITAKGSYSLKLTDRAGNSKTVKFKIS